MNRFRSNLDRRGRWIRALAGAVCLVGGIPAWTRDLWLVAILLGLAGLFCLFEALRGRCVLRACGIKTRWGAGHGGG